jgi:hypothetical protein
MSVGVVIPSRTELESLTRLIEQFDGAVDHIIIIDNGHEPELQELPIPYVGVEVIRDETPSIYHLWNVGFERAKVAGCEVVVFLNDDVELIGDLDTWFGRLIDPMKDPDVWVTCPDHTEELPEGATREVTGTFRHGGMPGFAFAVWAEIHEGFNEDYSWWYGDDEFAFKIERDGGKIIRVGGLHVKHHQSVTLNKTDVTEALVKDVMLFNKRWPGK